MPCGSTPGSQTNPPGQAPDHSPSPSCRTPPSPPRAPWGRCRMSRPAAGFPADFRLPRCLCRRHYLLISDAKLQNKHHRGKNVDKMKPDYQVFNMYRCVKIAARCFLAAFFYIVLKLVNRGVRMRASDVHVPLHRTIRPSLRKALPCRCRG